MAKSSPSLMLLRASALAVLPATLHGAKKKKAVTRIQPATKTNRTPAFDATPPTVPALPAATPRPRMENLDQILAASDTAGLPLAAIGAIVITARVGPQAEPMTTWIEVKAL